MPGSSSRCELGSESVILAGINALQQARNESGSSETLGLVCRIRDHAKLGWQWGKGLAVIQRRPPMKLSVLRNGSTSPSFKGRRWAAACASWTGRQHRSDRLRPGPKACAFHRHDAAVQGANHPVLGPGTRSSTTTRTARCSAPSILGHWSRPGREAWSEIWDGMLHSRSRAWCARARRSGRRTCSRSSAMGSQRKPISTCPTTRCGSNQEMWAAFTIVTETTERVIGDGAWRC
jgi:hypothetical protein